jgi:MYND finger
MTVKHCANEGCDKPGVSKCSGCLDVSYCGRECQTSDWKTHKQTCPSMASANCFIVRAAPHSASQSPLDNITAQLEHFPLKDIGNEVAEQRQLGAHLHYTGGRSREVGKFYDDKGTDQWYYYVYGAADAYTNKKLPRNEVGGLICYEPVYGDIAIVRSGPADGTYDAEIKSKDLKEAIEFHKTHDRRRIFAEREKSRFSKKFGLQGLI